MLAGPWHRREFHRSIKDYDDLFEADYWLQLRDHKGNVIDHDTQLRNVRNMTGADGQYSEYWYKKDDEIAEVKDEIENAIDGLNLEEYNDLNTDIKIMAFIQYALSQFDVGEFEY